MLAINDLLRHNQSVMDELDNAVGNVLASGWYVLGRQVREFERQFAAYCQTSHCITVANGTDALELALRALGVGQGSKVITVANAGAYSTTAILAVGAVPEYVEIDENTLLMSVEHLHQLIGPEIRAIVVTHLYGQAAPILEVLELVRQHRIPVVEDCAQAHGAMVSGKRVGSFGALGCFSFYPTKNLGALGDGGAITTSDAHIAQRVLRFRQYGWEKKYKIALAGGRNSRLDELQAAVLLVKLPHLDRWNQRRLHICQRYADLIKQPLLALPVISQGSSVGHLFVVRTPHRDSLQAHLKSHGIMADIHYPIPDHLQLGLSGMVPAVALPVTERACQEILTLPCFPEMTDAEVEHVINVVSVWQA